MTDDEKYRIKQDPLIASKENKIEKKTPVTPVQSFITKKKKLIATIIAIVIIGSLAIVFVLNSRVRVDDQARREQKSIGNTNNLEHFAEDSNGVQVGLKRMREYLRTTGVPCDREDSFGTAVGNIVIDHQNTNNLYITARPKGVFKSADRGKTWKESSEGILAYPSQKEPGKLCYDWLGKLYMDPIDSSRILLVATDVNNGTIEDPYTETAGLWETLDGGESWHQLLEPWMNAGGYGALAIDPESPQTVYFGSGYGVASYSEADPNKFFNTKGIIYKTTDG